MGDKPASVPSALQPSDGTGPSTAEPHFIASHCSRVSLTLTPLSGNNNKGPKSVVPVDDSAPATHQSTRAFTDKNPLHLARPSSTATWLQRHRRSRMRTDSSGTDKL